MTRLCEQLDAFIDGELSAAESAAFRAHLARCPDCPAMMRDVLALSARIRSLPPEHLVVGAGRPARPRAGRWLPAFGLLAAALVAVVFISRFSSVEPPLEVAAATRAIEGRLSHPLLAAHRPYDAARSGGTGAAAAPLADLARLEARGDRHGVAAAWLQRGELGQAEASLRALPESADVLSDRAALALARKEAAEALRLAGEALQRAPSHRPARWNRALALRALGLERLAAQELVALAEEDDAAWAEEARLRARSLQEQTGNQRGRSERLRTAGEAMIAGGPVIDDATARAQPGLSRLYFYDAVRTATEPERLQALRPLAVALDGLSGRTELQGLIDRVSKAPVDPRLAADYLRLVRRESPPPDARALVATAQKRGRTDTALGALLLSGLSASEPDRYRALAQRSGDPWFELLAAQTDARAQAAAGEWARAEATLSQLLQRCPVPGVEYRCGLAAVQLAQERIAQHRLDEAEPVLDQAEAFVEAAGDYGTGLQVLALRAESARLADALTLAEATLREYQLRAPDSCVTRRFVDVSLAVVLFQRGATDAARAALASAPDCGEPLPLQGALLLADLQRFGADPVGLERARAALEARRPEGTLVETILGRLALNTQDASGRARLEAVISRPGVGADAERARAYAFSTLLVDAAARGAFDRAFELAAQELEVELPARCAVVAALDDERWVSTVRGPTGALHGRLDRVSLPPGPLSVPEALTAHLSGCEQVTVLARPPVQGRAGLLPPSLAWSYKTSGSTPGTPSVGPRVIVTDVSPPATLGLAPLAPYRGEAAGAEVLRGAAATPGAVLAAARSASELQLHVHGTVGGALPSAARLVLSEDREGRYALTAEAIRAERLSGAPTVVLAACDSGDVAAYLHQAWGLPQAFRAAGARAVFAASGALPDLRTAAFFDAILARIRAGAPPAVALRDERQLWSARGEHWPKEVVLFE